MEKVVFYVFYAFGMAIKYLFIGIFRLIFFWIQKHEENKPPQTIFLNDGLRFEHTLITCGSGWGKTQLLQKQILEELPAVRYGQRSVVVIDSQGDMIRKILALKDLAPAPPPPPEVIAEEPDKIQETDEPVPSTPRKAHTPLKYFFFSLLILVLHVFIYIAIKAAADMVFENNGTGTQINLAVYATAIVLGVSAGLLLYRAVNWVEFVIGAVAFSICFGSWKSFEFIDTCLLISGTIGAGLGLRLLFGSSNTKPTIKPRTQPQVIEQQPTIADRLVYIDPSDISNPPALNLFDFGLDRIKDYDEAEQEKLLNGAIAMYEFMFGALLGAEMTNRQGVIFRYLARLMMVVPDATIYTLMDFLEHPETVKPYMPKLDMATRRFLDTQFFSSGFSTTREQILSRLWGVLSNPTLARMFSHTKNKLNLFEAMNNGSLILINTNKELLKQEGCVLFGRFMIALLSQATQERAAVPENQRKPTFVYIDEAHDYFDETLELLLNTARKYFVGLTLAHQNLAQFHRKLEQTVLASTSTKWAGGNSADDAFQLAKEMNCPPEFIRGLQKEPGMAHFAFFARNQTPNAVEMLIPLGLMERQPKMTAEEQKELLEQNRKRVGARFDKNLVQQATTPEGVFALEEAKAL